MSIVNHYHSSKYILIDYTLYFFILIKEAYTNIAKEATARISPSTRPYPIYFVLLESV